MLAPVDLLYASRQHPYWLSYTLFATFGLLRKQGPALKRLALRLLKDFDEINHTLCETIRSCHADWSAVGTQLPARKTRTKKPNSGHEDSVANH
jgi:hypothetical protein